MFHRKRVLKHVVFFSRSENDPKLIFIHFVQLFWNLENPTVMLYEASYIYKHLGTWPVLHSSNFLLIGRNSFTDCVPKVNYFLLKLFICVPAQFSVRVRTRRLISTSPMGLWKSPHLVEVVGSKATARDPLSLSLSLALYGTALAFDRLALLSAGLF